jgi:putative NAD(P)-binding protein
VAARLSRGKCIHACIQALDWKDAEQDPDSRRFMNKCHARSVLLLNRCTLNLATRVNPVGRQSYFAAIGILKVAIPLDRVTRPKVALSSRAPSCDAPGCIAVSQAGSDREHDAVATVLIIGASRGIGLEAVKAALKAGHSVRALARSARRIRVNHPQLEKMAGDALEMATVKRALTGIDVVFQSLGVSVGPEIILKPTRFFSKATRVLVTAMEEAQVKRLICMTGFGAGDSRGHDGFL